MMRKNHHWQDWERDLIQREYRHTKQSCVELAEKLTRLSGSKVTWLGVRGQVIAMGIAKRTDHRPWSPREVEQLEKLMPVYCPRRIARIMHRSINSVVVKAKKLKIYRRTRNGWFTKREACEILGMDHKRLQRRIDSGALKATYHYEHRPQQKGMSAWHIDEKDLRDYIRTYPEEINSRNADLLMIVEILAGIKNNH